MRYRIKTEHLDLIVEGLKNYYDDLWRIDVLDKLSNSMQSDLYNKIGTVKGTYDSIMKTITSDKNNAFSGNFRAEFTKEMEAFFANDVRNASMAASAIKLVLDHFISLIPGVHKLVQMGADLAFGSTMDYLRDKGLDETDKRFAEMSNDEELKRALAELNGTLKQPDKVKKAIDDALNQYESFVRYLSVLPNVPQDMDSLFAYPMFVFKMQRSSSAININLYVIKKYISAIEERAFHIQNKLSEYRTTFLGDIRKIVISIISSANIKGGELGLQNVNTLLSPPMLVFRDEKNIATLLADYTAHAFKFGYYYGNCIECEMLDMVLPEDLEYI